MELNDYELWISINAAELLISIIQFTEIHKSDYGDTSFRDLHNCFMVIHK